MGNDFTADPAKDDNFDFATDCVRDDGFNADHIKDNGPHLETEYNIYAQQLFPLGYGYPLNGPQTICNRKSERAQIGDVGFLNEGEFIRLFNATLPLDPQVDRNSDSKSSEAMLPEGHQPFPVNTSLLRKHDNVIDSYVCSRNVRCSESECNSTTASSSEAVKILAFKCSDTQGAFVAMATPANKTEMLAPKSLVPYMRNNIERWYEHARKLDCDITRQQIIFVSGVTKAEDWFLGAFTAKDGMVEFDTSAPFGACRRAQCNTDCRGQYQAPCDKCDESLARRGTEPDQTLFFHYYKMRGRDWNDTRAADQIKFNNMEDDDMEDDDMEDDEMEADVIVWSSQNFEVCSFPAIQMFTGFSTDYFAAGMFKQLPYDPVDILLEYILDRTKDDDRVRMAIASDLHVYALFGDEVPMGLKGALKELNPPVTLIHEDVACLAAAQWAEVCTDLEEVHMPISDGNPHKNPDGAETLTQEGELEVDDL